MTEYYDEREEGPLPIPEQDLRLLKAITSDARLALDFVSNNDSNVFSGEARPVGKVVCDYIRSYKTTPTKRVLLDKYQKDHTLSLQIERVFDEFPVIEFNPSEYQYDIEKLRQRYCDTKFNALKDDIRFHDKDSSDGMLDKMENALKDIKKVRQHGKSAYVQKSIDEYLNEFHQDYIAKIENPELGQGILTGYSYLDYVTNGLSPAELLIIGAETGQGKALDLNTPILTPNGFKSLRDIHPFDSIFGRDGNVYKVLAENEVITSYAWKFTFNDRSEIISHENHLWLTLDQKEQLEENNLLSPAGTIRSTEKIVDDFLTKNNSYAFPICESLFFPSRNLLLDPYLLGLWLVGTMHGTESDKLVTQFRSIGVLDNKHIPNEYLFSSKKQRLSLLKGLLSANSSSDGNQQIEFVNTNKKIIDGMEFLLNSLGETCIITERLTICNEMVQNSESPIVTSPVWTIRFTPNFYKKFRYLVRAERIESVQMKCIQVSSPDNLFLCGKNLIPTHNSMLLNNIAIQMWMQKNTIGTDPLQYTRGYNVLYFSLEMPYKGCFRRTMARLADVPTYGLRDSNLSKCDTESLEMASRFIKKYSKQNKFEIVDIPRGVTVNQIEERFLEAKTRFEPDVVIVDYLGLLEDSEAEGDDWLKLGFIAGKLHEFGRAYNTRIMTAVQLNRPTKSQKNSDPADLVGVHRIGRSSLIMHHANIGVQIETRKDESARDTMIYHIIKNRDGELGKHEVRKKFAHAAIFDLPFMPPDKDEFGSFVSGFDDNDDISSQVRKILKLNE